LSTSKSLTRTNLDVHPLPLAHLGRETRLDGGDRSSASTRVAGDEIQSVLALTELRVGTATGLAGYVFDNIPPQHVLDLLLLESALDDQSLTPVHTSASSQLSEQELRDVFVVSLHALADLGDVCKNRLFVAFT